LKISRAKKKKIKKRKRREKGRKQGLIKDTKEEMDNAKQRFAESDIHILSEADQVRA
jgi:hypothetical protein